MEIKYTVLDPPTLPLEALSSTHPVYSSPAATLGDFLLEVQKHLQLQSLPFPSTNMVRQLRIAKNWSGTQR
jgi:hypothetical protein